MADTYRVKLQGVLEGFDREQVVQKLALLFKREPDVVRPMLGGGGTVVKQGVDLDTARKYQQALLQQGCACAIESEKPPLALDPKPAPPPPAPAKAALALDPVSKPSPAPASGAAKPATAAAMAAGSAANPYAPPASTAAAAEPVEDDADLEALAFGQKLVIYSIIANFAWAAMRTSLPPLLGGLAALAITIMAFVGVWKITSALGSNIVMKILAILSMFIPLANVIVLVMLSMRATKRLRAGGYSVGLLGARH